MYFPIFSSFVGVKSLVDVKWVKIYTKWNGHVGGSEGKVSEWENLKKNLVGLCKNSGRY